MTWKTPLIAASLACLLVACGEKPQTAQTRKSDAQPWSGTSNAAYAAPGWKQGDEHSWDEQMRKRAQGQNEYARGAAM